LRKTTTKGAVIAHEKIHLKPSFKSKNKTKKEKPVKREVVLDVGRPSGGTIGRKGPIGGVGTIHDRTSLLANVKTSDTQAREIRKRRKKNDEKR